MNKPINLVVERNDGEVHFHTFEAEGSKKAWLENNQGSMKRILGQDLSQKECEEIRRNALLASGASSKI